MILSIIMWFAWVLIISGAIYLVLKLRKPDFRGGSNIIGTAVLLIFIFTLFRSLFIPDYPNSNSASYVEDELIRQYNPGLSYTVTSVKKWINVNEIGWMYVDRIESVDGQQFRMFYRLIGLHLDDVFKLNMTLSDDNSNMYEGNGGGLHAALLLSAGAMNFLMEDETTVVGEEFQLLIADNIYKLY